MYQVPLTPSQGQVDQLISEVADEHGIELGQDLNVHNGALKSTATADADQTDLSKRLAELRNK